jgi:hypothetical protein
MYAVAAEVFAGAAFGENIKPRPSWELEFLPQDF